MKAWNFSEVITLRFSINGHNKTISFSQLASYFVHAGLPMMLSKLVEYELTNSIARNPSRVFRRPIVLLLTSAGEGQNIKKYQFWTMGCK